MYGAKEWPFPMFPYFRKSVRTAARMKLAGEEIGERKSQLEATTPDQMGGDGGVGSTAAMGTVMSQIRQHRAFSDGFHASGSRGKVTSQV